MVQLTRQITNVNVTNKSKTSKKHKGSVLIAEVSACITMSAVNVVYAVNAADLFVVK